MRESSFFVDGLVELSEAEAPAERRALFRQAMHTLARASNAEGARPLDALDPQRMLLAVRVALADGLFDDLDWLAAEGAACAIYELAAAIPAGPEQRELGRRMLARFQGGRASTFAALAARIARGNPKLLLTAPARARLTLMLDLPLNSVQGDGPLALAIASRRELSGVLIDAASTGSLAARRSAARLLERAAREAATRARQGDTHAATRVLGGDALRPTWERLLGDREPLVWRHLAIAQGLLAPYVREFDASIEAGLRAAEHAEAQQMGPTSEQLGGERLSAASALGLPEVGLWRRALVAHLARMAVDPDVAWDRVLPVLHVDGGAIVPAFWGLVRAYEAEPEAASVVVILLVRKFGYATIEGLTDLRRELGETSGLGRLLGLCLRELPEAQPETDPYRASIVAEALADVYRTPRVLEPLRDILERALIEYAKRGAASAHEEGQKLLRRASLDVRELSTLPDLNDAAVPVAAVCSAFTQLRDMDSALLSTGTVSALLALGTSAAEAAELDESWSTLREELAEWLIAQESDEARAAAPAMHLRRLRCLLRVVDGDVADSDDNAASGRTRTRWMRLVRKLVSRVEAGPPPALRRTILATIARALDALLRSESVSATDAILMLTQVLRDPADLDVLAEASMHRDFERALFAYATFVRACEGGIAGGALGQAPINSAGLLGASACADPAVVIRYSVDGRPDSLMPPAHAGPSREQIVRGLTALEALSLELAGDGSARAEALRTLLVKLTQSLRSVADAASLRALCSEAGDADAVAQAEAALHALAQLSASARARFDAKARRVSLAPPAQSLAVLVQRVVGGGDARLREERVRHAAEQQTARVAFGIRDVAAAVFNNLVELPLERGAQGAAPDSLAQLPAWVPPRRTLGGFYLVRGLGTGASGSVFLVSRVEERRDPLAERFALKVPEFSENAARLLTEEEFLRLFREEASALLGIPEHPNLAKFVTFDLAARPKPILVMEYVEGDTLERIVTSGTLTVERALRYLRDVLEGLCAMHAVGLGHLDVKPSNVVVRGGERAVLVDFGLSGRKVRLGCATGPYGAPEVWGAVEGASLGDPASADVYAFGCLVYELLLGRPLFDGPHELALVAQHVSHDGQPPAIRKLADAGEMDLAEFLFSALRQSAPKRARTTELLAALKGLESKLKKKSWPLLTLRESNG